jgi:hypothetical protein
MRLFGNSHARGRRSVPRTEAALIAVLSTSAADHPAELIDVSRTGARLTGKLLPGVGEEVTFTAESVTVAARGSAASVTWRSPRRLVNIRKKGRPSTRTALRALQGRCVPCSAMNSEISCL